MNQYITVYALNRYIKAKLDQDYQLQDFYIKGEISNYRPHPSGHMYFTLKDEKASVNAIMFQSYAKDVPFKIENGLNIIAKCHVSVYEKSGQYQIYIKEMSQDGIGNLYLKFEQLKQKLEKEGLFDSSHKKTIPTYPSSIAILSAKQGAALQDTLRVIRQRYPVAQVVIFPIPVQGKDAYKIIINALLSIDKLGFSTLLLVRGGGSIEELWNFNEEMLARCIYDLKTPIITGIGHQTDFTLVDFVSDLRSSTPTDAAMKATPDINELAFHLNESKIQLNRCIKHKLDLEKQYLNRLKSHYIFTNPMRIYENELLKVNNIQDYLKRYGEHFLFKNKNEIKNMKDKLDLLMNNKINNSINDFNYKVTKLDLVSPLKILNKGYSLVFKDDKVVKSISHLKKDDNVVLRLSDGYKNAKILED